MNKQKRIYPIVLAGVLCIAALLAWGWQVKVADAACGASTSSCKTCHEVQGQDSVAKKGDWHVQHAFGDFCAACHLGVATENDKTKAHAGFIKNPLTQSDQTCATCHPSDTAARVAKYGGSAGSSGSTGSSGSSNTSTPASGQSAPSGNSADATPSEAASQVPQVQASGTQAASNSANPNYDLIDFNKNLPGSFPWLSWIFGLIDILMGLAVAVMAWKWIKGVWPWSYLPRRQANLLDLHKMSPELQEVIVELQQADTKTLLAIQELFKRGRSGQTLLQTVVNLPDSLLAQLQALSESEMELLFQVSRAMREQKGGMNSVN